MRLAEKQEVVITVILILINLHLNLNSHIRSVATISGSAVKTELLILVTR